MKSRCSAVSTRTGRSTVVRVCCQKQGEMKTAGIAVATFAAIALFSGPADAKVLLSKINIPKAFQATEAPAVVGSPTPKSSGPKEEFGFSESFNPSALFIPATLAVVGGGYTLASKVDPELEGLIDGWLFKKSDLVGAGYEDTIKADGGFVVPKVAKTVAKAGTKKVKAASAAKGGLSFPSLPFKLPF